MSKPQLTEVGSASANQDAIVDDNFDKLYNQPFPIVHYALVGDLPDPTLYDTCLATVWDEVPGNAPITYQSNGAAWVQFAAPSTFPKAETTVGSVPAGTSTIFITTNADAGDGIIREGAFSSDWGILLPLDVDDAVRGTLVNISFYGYSGSKADLKVNIDWVLGSVSGQLIVSKGSTKSAHVAYYISGSVGTDIECLPTAGDGTTETGKIFRCSNTGVFKEISKLPSIVEASLVSVQVSHKI